MELSRIAELVGQAEKEGITLAAMLSKEMSPGEMELLQAELASHMSDNYAKIENFMSGISIPSMEEVLSRRDEELTGTDLPLFDLLSDDEPETESA